MRAPRILLLDNFDSFTFNLAHYLIEGGGSVTVIRNDAIAAPDAVDGRFDGVVISPGPGTPDNAGISLDLVAACIDARLPLLGVCLGHQAIARHYGYRIVRGGLMHGKTAKIRHDGSGVFIDIPSPFRATRYHSLLVENDPGIDMLKFNAFSRGDDGQDVIMGLRHRDLPIHGVQFHPESIATEHGKQLLRSFLSIASQDSLPA